MFGYLLLIFTLVPAVELAVLIKVGTHIGVGNTLFLIFLTGVLGASLARLQGFAVYLSIQTSLQKGRMPSEEMLDGLMILVGGIVLLTPGFITDFLGFLLLIPWTRRIIKSWLRRKFEQMTREEQIITTHCSGRRKDDDIEDAEYF